MFSFFFNNRMWLKLCVAVALAAAVFAAPSNQTSKVEKPDWRPRFLGQVPLQVCMSCKIFPQEAYNLFFSVGLHVSIFL